SGSLTAVLDLTTIQTFDLAPPVYNWGASRLFDGVATPLNMTDNFIRSGQRLQPAFGGQAVAGFVSSPTTGQAAVVIGNSGRTIVNGFALEEVSQTLLAIQFAQNEIEFLAGPTSCAAGATFISQP